MSTLLQSSISTEWSEKSISIQWAMKKFSLILWWMDPKIIELAKAINARANQALKHRWESTKVGPYGIGFWPQTVRNIREILDFTCV